VIALLMRDLRLAVRAGGGFGLGLAFFLILAVLVPLGVGPEGDAGAIAPGILWVGALLACLLSLDRIFALDYEDGSLDLLATAPIPLEGVVAIKALAHWLTTGLPLVLAARCWGASEPAGRGLWLADPVAPAGHARAVGDRHLWRGADRGAEARRAALSLAGAAAVYCRR
jgi:heme exporter protein B